MIIIGIDPHPATFTAAVLDASSAGVFGTLEVDNSEVGPPTAPKVGPPKHSEEEELLQQVAT